MSRDAIPCIGSGWIAKRNITKALSGVWVAFFILFGFFGHLEKSESGRGVLVSSRITGPGGSFSALIQTDCSRN
jgi:hypothetical protein